VPLTGVLGLGLVRLLCADVLWRQAVVEARTATLGPRHADTLFAQVCLAQSHLHMGDARAAAALLEVASPGLAAAGHWYAVQARAQLEEVRQGASSREGAPPPLEPRQLV
jgi:hypothetical protein